MPSFPGAGLNIIASSKGAWLNMGTGKCSLQVQPGIRISPEKLGKFQLVTCLTKMETDTSEHVRRDNQRSAFETISNRLPALVCWSATRRFQGFLSHLRLLSKVARASIFVEYERDRRNRVMDRGKGLLRNYLHVGDSLLVYRLPSAREGLWPCRAYER